MSAAATLALSLLAMIPGATGDRTTNLGPAIEVQRGYAHAVQPFVRSGPARTPARLSGASAWSCRAVAGGGITCTARRTTRTSTASIRYTAGSKRSSAVVDVAPR